MRAEDLRKSILQQAIQGKLVKQNPADEPASVLLERIRAEKDRLVAEGKLKKDKNPSYIYQGDDGRYYEKVGKDAPVDITDKVPFEIPTAWHWYRLGEILINYDSKRRPITKQDRVNELGLYDYYGATGAIDKVDSYIFDGEFLMIGEDGGNFFTDRENSFIASGKFWANNHVHVVQPILCNIWFTKYFLDSCNLSAMGLIKGIAVPKLNQANMNSILIPLPPLAEQERIVKRIEELMPLVDEYARLEAKDKALDEALPTVLKKSILQQAIQGKLVEQDANDEPASVLLERIRTEKKAQLGKKYVESYIYKGGDCYYEKVGSTVKNISDEIPFDIPDSWRWCRVNDYVLQVTDFVASGSFATLRENVKYYKTENYALLVKTQDFANNFSKDLTYTDKHGYEFLKKSNVFGGELILSNVGSIGKVFIVPPMNRPATLAPNAIMVRCHESNQTDWLYFLFRSNFGLDALLSISSATAIKKFNKTDFKGILIPVPPLAEQKRIVEKLNEIFAKL